MATATLIDLTQPQATTLAQPEDIQHEATHIARLCRQFLNEHHQVTSHHALDPALSPDEVLTLPLDHHRLPDILHRLPGRKSARQRLAAAIAALLYPVEADSLAAIIRYEADRIKLRDWGFLQRQYDRLAATKRNGRTLPGLSSGVEAGVQSPVWADRMTKQGRWDPEKKPISTDGVPAVPMPVQLAEEEDLAPFIEHLASGGTHVLDAGALKSPDVATDVPRFGFHGIEFGKGGLYEDGVMDLCKMVVGPERVGRLMDSLRENTWVRHFLLGNNIIGPVGARAIASFIGDFPERMETWYLGGNCIDATSLRILVDAILKSPVVTGVWLKRNPLGPGSVESLFRLVTEAQNLHTLDLDQTELSNQGAAKLFNMLARYNAPEDKVLPLRHLYMTGTGLSVGAVEALGAFLQSPHCGVTSIYMCCNPLGDAGIAALASALPRARSLRRISLQSVGMTSQGARLLFDAVGRHGQMRMIDVGQAFITEDLGQAYNYIEDDAVDSIAQAVKLSTHLEYLVLGHCPISGTKLTELSHTLANSKSLLFYNTTSILPGSLNPETAVAEKAVQQQLEANVLAVYGQDMTYDRFLDEEKRWLRSDRSVKHTDSLFRSRDVWKARRGIKPLVKRWDEGDDTLDRVRRQSEMV